MSHFANTFPSLEGGVVTQGHADYCRDNGHATNTKLGTNAEPVEISERCPRCGDLLSADDLQARWIVTEDLPTRNALYSAWSRATRREQAVVDVAAKRAARAEAEREAREQADAADAALTGPPKPGDVVTNSARMLGIVTEPVRKAGIHKGRLGVQYAGQPYAVVERPSRVTVIPKSDLAAFLAALKPEPATSAHKHGATENDVDPATYGKCIAKTNGRHSIEWIKRPAVFHDGEQISGDEWRGFCWACDERFTEGA